VFKRLALAVLVLVAVSAHAATAIRNVHLFDGVRVVPNATVVFDQGRITAVGTSVAVPQGAEVSEDMVDTNVTPQCMATLRA